MEAQRSLSQLGQGPVSCLWCGRVPPHSQQQSPEEELGVLLLLAGLMRELTSLKVLNQTRRQLSLQQRQEVKKSKSNQIAVIHSKADAFFKAAVSLVPDVPKMISVDGKMRPSDAFLLEFLCNFFSTLLVVPDHPEQGVLFLVRGLLNVIQDYTWEDNSDDKVRIYTNVLHLLSAMTQEAYIYHVDKVDSNDTLYGGDSKFLAEINKLCETVIAQILDHLKTLGKEETLKRQSQLALYFFNTILAHGDLRNNKLNQLSVNLWNLAQKHGFADTKTMVKTLEYIKRRSKQPEMSHFTDLALRLPLQSRT